MKALFIAYNQAYHEEILGLMNQCQLRGYTDWEVVRGRGTKTGEPHLGDHAWPTLNSSMIIFGHPDKISNLKVDLKKLDTVNPAMGLHFFSWDVDEE
jgi:hypothetical protein